MGSRFCQWRRLAKAVVALSILLVHGSAYSDETAGLSAYRKKSPARKVSSENASQDSSQELKKKKKGARNAVVKTDGAQVYSDPDFDSNAIAVLSAGRKVRVSRGKTGTYAKFHRVKVDDKIGFIADIDVALEDEGGSDEKIKPKSAEKRPDRKVRRDDEKAELARQRKQRNEPMFFSKYVGLFVGQSEFKESISGVNASESLLVYGFKFTGPDIVFSGPVVDFNVALHSGAPSYYNALSEAPPTGLLVWTDAVFVLPLVNALDSMLYTGAGPLFVLTNFRVFSGGRSQSLTALNAGASFVLGGAVRVERVALRLEGKFMWEKETYKSLLFSVQTDI